MASNVIIISNNLLDVSAIVNSVGTKYKVIKHRDLIKGVEHLTNDGSACSVIIGYPLEALTPQEHRAFMKEVAKIKSDFKHVSKCIIYGPHDRMQKELKSSHDVECIARSVFFHDPLKWLS